MIATIRIERPGTRNTIDLRSARQIIDACTAIGEDSKTYCVIVTGAGRKYFCSGADSALVRESLVNRIHSPVEALASLAIPVIAAINGKALNLGMEMALACDIRIASQTAEFGFPGIAHGVLPADGGTQRLPRVIGKGRALELLLSGRIIDAAEAHEIGLVDEVVAPAKLAIRAQELAGQIAHKAPIAVRYAKEAVRSALDMPLEQGLKLEGDLYLLLQTTRDRAEGVHSFLKKKQPDFIGE